MILQQGKTIYIFPHELGGLAWRNHKENLAQAYQISRLDGIYVSTPVVVYANRKCEIPEITLFNSLANMDYPFIGFVEHGLIFVVHQTKSLYSGICLEDKHDARGTLVTYSKTHICRAPNGFKYLWRPPVARLS